MRQRIAKPAVRRRHTGGQPQHIQASITEGGDTQIIPLRVREPLCVLMGHGPREKRSRQGATLVRLRHPAATRIGDWNATEPYETLPSAAAVAAAPMIAPSEDCSSTAIPLPGRGK